VLRGGSFLCVPGMVRSANRGLNHPQFATPEGGFRVAMSYGRP